MMSVLSGLSLTIIFLSFMVFTLAFQLLITKKSEKIRTLLYLGYGVPDIIKYYAGLFIVVNALIAGLAIVSVVQLKDAFFAIMLEFKFPVPAGIDNLVYLAGGVITAIIIVLNTLVLYRKVAGMDMGKK